MGGEIGEVGKENSNEQELRAYLDNFNELLKKNHSGATTISKISIQTGTSHGGVPLPDGTVADVNLDFNTLEKRLKDRGISSNWPGAINLSYVLESFLYYEQLLTDNSFSDRFKIFTINVNGDESTLIDQVESLVSDLVNLRSEDIIGSA